MIGHGKARLLPARKVPKCAEFYPGQLDFAATDPHDGDAVLRIGDISDRPKG